MKVAQQIVLTAEDNGGDEGNENSALDGERGYHTIKIRVSDISWCSKTLIK